MLAHVSHPHGWIGLAVCVRSRDVLEWRFLEAGIGFASQQSQLRVTA
jgi:hypothetical protein